MEPINISRCSNIQELTNRLEILSSEVEAAKSTPNRGVFNGFIVKVLSFFGLKQTCAAQIHTLLINNQELLSSSLHKEVRGEDKVFDTLEKLRDNLLQNEREKCDVYKIAEGIFSALKSSKSEMPNDRSTGLNYEVQLCQIVDPDITKSEQVAAVSKCIAYLKKLHLDPEEFLVFITKISPENRMETLSTLVEVMDEGASRITYNYAVDLAKNGKLESIRRALVLKHGGLSMFSAIDAIRTIPDDRQEDAIRLILRMKPYVYWGRGMGSAELTNFIKTIIKIPADQAESIIDLFQDQPKVKNLQNFITGLINVPPEERADLVLTAEPFCNRHDIDSIFEALMSIQDKKIRKEIVDIVESLRCSNHAEVIRDLAKMDPLDRASIVQDAIPLIGTEYLDIRTYFRNVLEISRQERKQILNAFGAKIICEDWNEYIKLIPSEERLPLSKELVRVATKMNLNGGQRREIFAYLCKLSFINDTFNPQIARQLMGIIENLHFNRAHALLTDLNFMAPDRRAFWINKCAHLEPQKQLGALALSIFFPDSKFEEMSTRMKNGNYKNVNELFEKNIAARKDMHDFLTAELERNLQDQNYTKQFCESLIIQISLLQLDQENSVLFQKVVEIRSALDGATSPYAVYKDLKKAEKEDPLIDLEMPTYTMTLEGKGEKKVAFNLAKVRQTAKTVTFKAKDIPDEYHPRQLKILFEGLKDRIKSLPKSEQASVNKQVLDSYKSTLSALESGLFDKPFMNEMMKERSADENVSYHLYKLGCITKLIINEEKTIPKDNQLSPQEISLLETAVTLSACTTGQRDGVDFIYDKFELEQRYLNETDREMGEGSDSFVEDLIREEIQKGFGLALRESAWERIIGKAVDQESHQTEYMSNRVGKQVGLRRALTFDVHIGMVNKALFDASTKQLAEAVYQTYPFETFVLNVKKGINKHMAAMEGTPGEKYRAWKTLIDKVPKFNECFDVTEDDDDDTGYSIDGINERGVVEVLKSMGYLVQR